MKVFHSFLSAASNHWRAALTLLAIVIFVTCRIVGRPFSYLGFALLVVWLVYLAFDQRDWLRLRWDAIFHKNRLADEARIEGDTALAAVAMDSTEGDKQVAGQLAAWRTNAERLTDLLASPGLTPQQRLDTELLLRQTRRNIERVTKAESKRHAHATGYMPAFTMPALTGIAPLLLAFGLPAAAFGLQTLHANHEHALAERATETAEHNAHVADILAHERDTYKDALAAAQGIVTAARQETESERERTAMLARREREREHAIQSVLVNNEPPPWSLREPAALAPDGAGEHASPAALNDSGSLRPIAR